MSTIFPYIVNKSSELYSMQVIEHYLLLKYNTSYADRIYTSLVLHHF